MATITEMNRIQSVTEETEARRKHNAMIRDCYRRLQNAQNEQFGANEQNESAYEIRASVLAPERPAYTNSFVNTPTLEQTPQVTEFVRTRMETPVFTTEKFNAFQESAVSVAMPAIQQAVEEMPVQAIIPANMQAAAVEESYSLSRFAKMAMAAFATVTVAMFTLIGVNTRIIENKRMQLSELETQQATLMEEYAEIQNRIAMEQSEESIRQYVNANGLK
jgi:hypothetical protein